MSDGQSGRAEEDVQKLQVENRRNTSRRSRRKAARMARVRDYFAQRDRGASDTDRDESPPEAKQEAQEEGQSQKEKQSDVRSLSEGRSKSERSDIVSEARETCSESLFGVRHDTSPVHESISVCEPEKSESNDLADSATLTGGESTTDIPDNPQHSDDEPAPAESRNTNKSVSEAEGESQKQGTSYECTNSTADEPADSVISAVISESLVSQTTSFTFGTVVAPLYHQMFGRVGSESQSIGDGGNPKRATLNTGDLTQHYPYTERRESSSTAPTDVRNDNVQGNVIEMQESKQDGGSDATLNSPPAEEEQTGLSAGDILDRTDTLQDPGEFIQSEHRCTNSSEVLQPLSGDTEVHPHPVDILHADLLSADIHTQSLHLQGEAQEDNLTLDPRNRTTAETEQAQLPENLCSRIKASLDETLSQSEAQEVMASLDTSFLPLEPPQSVLEDVNDETNQQCSGGGENESNMEDDSGETITISTTTASSEAHSLSQPLHGLKPTEISDSAAKETASGYISHCETLEEKVFSTPDTSVENQEETNNAEEQNKLTNNSYEDETKHSAEIEVSDEEAESLTTEMMSNYHVCDDIFAELKGEDALKDEPIIVSEKIEHHEMEAAVLKQEDFSSADNAEVKNWEMMVEEEEENILTVEEESETISLKADIHEVEKDQGGQLDDAGVETPLDTTEEEKEKPQEKPVEELTAAGENGTKAEDVGGVEDEERAGEEEMWEIVAKKDGETDEKQLENVEATQKEKTAAEEEVAEEIEVEKRDEQEETEMEKEKDFAEIQEVNIKRTNVQEEEEKEGEVEMEMESNDGDETGVVWGHQVKPRENAEEENPNNKEEIVVDEAGASEVVDADSEGMTKEDGEDEVECFEERLDITQNKAEDGLSAPVSVQDKSVIDKEQKGGSARIPTEMHLYKEEDFQSSENVTHDRSKADNESLAAEGDSCVLTDEPESDQTSHESASADSDSDDEVELYMHCLRAVHAGAQAAKDRNKDTGFSVGKRPSVSRSKLLSTRMPSISESLDEEQHLSCLHEDQDVADLQPTSAALPLSSEQRSASGNLSWWKKTFSCSNISKTLLYTTLFVVFLVVAYHYDFLACFGLYLISVVWLYCQGERPPPAKNNNRIG